MSVPAELWSAAQAASADAHTIDTLGIPSAVLIERASLCVANEVQALSESLPVVCLVGPGNNGADALAVARILRGRGVDARAWLVSERRNAQGEAQLSMARSASVPIEQGLPVSWGQDAVWVDGLLGTGAKGPPRGAVAEALRWLGTREGPRIAIDVPSGVDVDTGRCAQEAFLADLTVTFVRAKPGLVVTPGRAHAGRVVVADIGIVPAHDRSAALKMVTARSVAEALSTKRAVAHKGDRGHVAVVGGSEGTRGAALLAGAAALRGGAGLCTWICEGRHDAVLSRPELMLAPWSEPVLPAANALVVGPGWTQRPAAQAVANLYVEDTRPAVWDASGLDEVVLRPAAAPRVLTPHPGEAARLMKRIDTQGEWTSAAVQARRIEVARALHAATGAVIVLKGAGTLVAEAGGVHVVLEGTAALSTAGTGDVLAGLIGALLAAGLDPIDAATAGASMHGRAGELAARAVGTPLALDVVQALPAAAAELAKGIACAREPRLVRG